MNAKLKSYKDLVVWSKSINLLNQMYEFPFCSSGEAQRIPSLTEEIRKMTNAPRRSPASRP
jgi:hypothetical protein